MTLLRIQLGKPSGSPIISECSLLGNLERPDKPTLFATINLPGSHVEMEMSPHFACALADEIMAYLERWERLGNGREGSMYFERGKAARDALKYSARRSRRLTVAEGTASDDE